ncbi:MAG TPA: glycosyltransferase family 4 protein [Candidatus Acidoferrales bacterium]|nr:glycosyltransferase family 4 protein [Candidatus Acidoferrales bacterium]
MRVAILITDLIANGGAPRQAMLLARWLRAFGHDATLYAVRYCPENCFPEIAASLDIRAVRRLSLAEVLRRNQGRHHGIASGAKRHFWESRLLANLVREPCDILNPHVRGATRAATMRKRRTGAPVVWMCDDARNWEAPGYRPYYAPPVQWLFDHVMARLEKPVVRQIDRIVTLDHRVKRILEGYYGRPADVVRSGLDSVWFRARPEARQDIRARYGFEPGDFLLLWLGIIEPHRRLEDAVEALGLLQRRGRADVRLLIAGNPAFAPQYVRKLQELVDRNQLGNFVRFHLSAVPENEMADYYSAADALVYLAENQCWGLGVFEALACGLPVIVSRACGAHEVLEDRRTAMLVSPRNSGEFVEAVAELAGAPEFRRMLVTQARERVLNQITWEAYARNMLREFEHVLGERSASIAAGRREAFA